MYMYETDKNNGCIYIYYLSNRLLYVRIIEVGQHLQIILLKYTVGISDYDFFHRHKLYKHSY